MRRDFLRSPVMRSMTRYAVVGSIGALSDWLIFAFFLYVVELNYLLAGTISFVIATLINYVLSLLWVFEGGRHSRHKEVTLIYLVSAVGLLINLLALYLLYEGLGLHVFVAKVLASLSAFVWNFGARYLWVFERAVAPVSPATHPAD
jgi:putative flippase GtrA